MTKYLIECIASFFLMLLIGLGAVLGLAGEFAPLAIGIGLVALVYMGGQTSMAHYNPAVTLSLFIRGRCPGREVLPYFTAQFVGAALAALVVGAVFAGKVEVNGATAEITRWTPGATAPVIASEALVTFLLVFVILNFATGPNAAGNGFYGLAYGFTVLAGTLAVGAVSLGSFNPAVTLGLAFMGRLGWADIWMHLLPQILGSVLATFSFKALHPDNK